MAEAHSIHERQKGRGKHLRDYLPLLVLVLIAGSAALAKQVAYGGGWQGQLWMHDFMGVFLLLFSMFKFFDLPGFADGFQMYDLLAKRVRPWAYVYPFLEFALGIGYLSWFRPQAVYWSTIVLMGFGALGVINALVKKLDLECACMGTVLHVPLSTVALVEDVGMVAMAAWMLTGAA